MARRKKKYPQLVGVSGKADGVVKHALGISQSGYVYRNRYVCDRDRAECRELEAMGWLAWQQVPVCIFPSGGYWYVTEACMAVLGVNPDDAK